MARRKTTPARYPLIGVILLLLALLGWPVAAQAQTYTISPPPFLLAQNNSGTIINNACIWTYTAGTVTVAATYADAAGTLNSNPIRSDSAGRFTAFLSPGNSYKFVYESACTPPAHGTTLRTADNISAMPPSGVNVDVTGTAGESIVAGAVAYVSDGSGSLVAGQWYNASSSNTYSSTTATIVGIASTAVTSGNSGSFRISGRMTGLAGLTVGSSYYIAASAGTTTATAPSAARLIGIADSATSLIIAPNPKTVPTQPNNVVDGRLTATTGTPVTTADVSGATSIYYTPYTGNRIALFDGASTWNTRTFAEITISITTCTASKPYDVFLYDNVGVVTAETLVWGDGVTRATAIVRQDGVWVKSGATTRRYVGSFYCNASGGQTDDTAAKRSLWNEYNRVRRPLRVLEATDTWTYTTDTYRQANASTANQAEVMIGVADTQLELAAIAQASNTNADVARYTAIGEDSTTTPLANQIHTWSYQGTAALFRSTTRADVRHYPAVGRHVYVWLERSAAVGTTTWEGDTGDTTTHQTGLIGSIEG